jgi:hypothetical protein
MTATNWIGASGNWGDAANWSAGVPDGTSVATLGDTGAYSASIDTGDSFSIGTLNITGPHAVFDFYGTLNVNSAINLSAGNFVLAGTIVGGEIRQTGGSITFAGTPLRANNPYPGADGTLDGVKFVGTMNLANDTAVVNIKDGLTVTGSDGTSPGVVNMTGSDAQINFYGSQTFDNATVNIGGNGLYSYLLAYDQNGAATTLTLGPNLDVVATTGNVYFGGDSDATIVNQGTITAGVSGKFFEVYSRFTNQGTIDISGEVFAINTPDFTNTGTINVTANGSLLLEGDQIASQLGNIVVNGGSVEIGGTLDNSGNVLKVGAHTDLGVLTLLGTIASGTIKDSGSGIHFQQHSTLDGVTYQGALTLGGEVNIVDGLTLENAAGTGRGTLKVASGSVQFEGTQTIANATITLGSPGDPGELDAVNPQGAPTPSTLTLGSGVKLVTSTNAALGGNGKIVNRGLILSQTLGTFTIDPAAFVNDGRWFVNGENVVIGSAFTNNGAIEVTNNILEIKQAATGTGSYQINKNGTLAFDGNTSRGSAILFYGVGGTLQIGSTSGFAAGYIGGFAQGDSIDLKKFAYSSSIQMSYANNKLVVTAGTQTATLHLVGNYSAASFVAASDGATGTVITYNAPTPAAVAHHSSALGHQATDNRLSQFVSAIAVHSSDTANFHAITGSHEFGISVPANLLAASPHP